MEKRDYNFKKYLNLGFSVIPVHYINNDGSCSCGIKNCENAGKHTFLSWGQYQKKRLSLWQAETYENKGHNIAIIMGEVSGCVVIDIDGDYPSDWPKLPKTWTVETARGQHYYFKYEKGLRNTVKIEGHKIDFRAEGGYAVAPPSVHETGVVYHWSVDPEDCEIASLPTWFKEKLNTKKKNSPYKNAPVPKVFNYEDPYIEAAINGEISELRSIGEGGRNNQLNKSAIKLAGLIPASQVHSILEPIALEIGLGHIETEKTINSACGAATPRKKPNKKYEADNLGSDETPALVKNILSGARTSSTPPPQKFPNELIDAAPTLVKTMVKWMLQTAQYPLPELCLAAAIPCIGNVMAHRIQSYTKLRTNFYTMGIAESGSGKDHPHDCNEAVILSSGLKDTFLGIPKSDTGVVKSVKRAGGHAYMPIDEFGRFFGGTKGSANHLKQIPTKFMHLYNHANKMYIGEEYADNEHNGGRGDIDQPCLNIFATTVPQNFYDALSSGESSDGFLSRWLVFETDRFDIDPQEGWEILGEPPSQILDAVEFWRAQPKFVGGPDGDLAKLTMIHPRVVPFADNGDAYNNYRRECRIRARDSQDPSTRAIWNRAAEHAMKLSLLGTEPDFVVHDDAFEWAKNLSKWLAIDLIKKVQENVSDTAYQAELLKVQKILRKKQPISRSDLTRSTQFLDGRKRKDIIDTLLESGFMRAEEKPRNDGRGTYTVYSVV